MLAYLGMEKTNISKKVKLNQLHTHLENTEHIGDIFTALNEGATITPKQEKYITIVVVEELRRTSFNFDLFEKILTKGIVIPLKYLALASLYCCPSFMLYVKGNNEQTSLRYTRVKRLYSEKIKTDEFKSILFSEWKKIIDSIVDNSMQYQTIKHTTSFYQMPHTLFEDVVRYPVTEFNQILFEQANEKDYLDVLIKLTNYPRVFSKIDNIDTNYFKQESAYYEAIHLSKIIEENSQFYHMKRNQSQRKTKEQKIEEKIGNVTPELPLYCQGILNEIKLLFTEIKKDKQLLNSDEIFNAENLYIVRLPEVLSKYNNINQSYLIDNNSTQNKTTDELLYDSLLQIQNIYENLLSSINEVKIKNLSIQQKYIQEIKNRMM